MVETTKHVLAVRVPEWYKPPQDLPIREWPFPDPYLAAVVQLAPRDAQIVVSRWHGASVANISLYGLVGGKLVALRVRPRRDQNELSLFGTVGTGATNIRCARHGPLIVLGQGPTSSSGKSWFVSRGVYRLIGTTVRLVHTHTVVSSATGANTIARRWGFDALPFTGCTLARGKRL